MRLCLIATLAVAFAFPVASRATVVNVDFNGANQGDISPQLLPYVGASAAGSGTIWNGVAVDSRTGVSVGSPTGTGNDYNLTITASNLLDETGVGTGLGFSFTHAGGDDNPAATPPNELFRDYLGANFGGNGPISFTISGLGSATSADLYFYHQFDSGQSAPADVVLGGTVVAYPTNGIFNSSNTLHFQNVPVSGGSINGTIAIPNGYDLINGLSIQTAPEPSACAMFSIGVVGLLIAARRRRNA